MAATRTARTWPSAGVQHEGLRAGLPGHRHSIERDGRISGDGQRHRLDARGIKRTLRPGTVHHGCNYGREVIMRIDAVCSCGPVVIKGKSFARAATEAAIHRGRCSGIVRVVAVFTRGEWSRLHADYKRTAADGQRCALHLDPADGTTCLVPALVM